MRGRGAKGGGGHRGAPSPATMIEARHGYAGATSEGGWGPSRGPITCDDDRGAPRLRRGATSEGGKEARSGPHHYHRDRGAPRLRRGATSEGGKEARPG